MGFEFLAVCRGEKDQEIFTGVIKLETPLCMFFSIFVYFSAIIILEMSRFFGGKFKFLPKIFLPPYEFQKKQG